jgi:predicted DNA-binding transcriptional regulator YafY
VRNDVERLRRLGYPVEATRGAAGGYRLGAGAAMPPLLLDDDEAVAVVVGLRAAAGRAVEGLDEAAPRALAKLTQVLPPRLRGRVSALGAATVPLAEWYPAAVDPETLTALAAAIARREALRLTYSAPGGQESRRRVEPHRLVSWGRRWYLVAFDDQRQDWRSFRVDRIASLSQTGHRAPARSLSEEDAAALVARFVNRPVPTYEAVATLHAPLEAVAGRLGDAARRLEPLDGGRCRLHSGADTLEWLAFRLATLGCEFELHGPPELLDYLSALAGRVARATAAGAGDPAALPGVPT